MLGYPVFRGEHEPAADHPHPIANAICSPCRLSSFGATARTFHPCHGLRGAGSVPGVADFNLHGRFRATGTVSGGQRRARAAAAGESRVVFLGDSITDYWKLPDYFPGKPYINRGIDGQTTPEMLVRFRQDVIDLHPKVLVVLAGTNDIAGVTGRTSNEDIEANYASMAELARAHHIRMVFASVLPVHNYTHDAEESFALRPRDRILALNKWLKDYCTKNQLRVSRLFQRRGRRARQAKARSG